MLGFFSFKQRMTWLKTGTIPKEEKEIKVKMKRREKGRLAARKEG